MKPAGMPAAQRRVNIKVLPDGRVRIHFFVRSETGAVKTPSAAIMTAMGPLQMGGVQGYIACQPKRADILPQVVGGITQLTVHSDDARAVTCPECCATQDYKDMMKALGEMLEVAPEVK